MLVTKGSQKTDRAHKLTTGNSYNVKHFLLDMTGDGDALSDGIRSDSALRAQCRSVIIEFIYFINTNFKTDKFRMKNHHWRPLRKYKKTLL